MPKMQVHLRGRPRDAGIDRAVLAAAASVFAEVGYSDASVLEIARRAGVSAPAFYRRWSNKAEVAIDLLARRARIDAPDTGDIRRDLADWVRARIELFTDPLSTQLLLAVSTVGFVHAPTWERLQAVWSLVASPMRQRLEMARERGELRAEVDPELIFDAAMGAVLFPLMQSHRPRRQEDVEGLVALLLD